MTEHFTLAELTASEIAARKGLANLPGPEALANLHRLAEFLEAARRWLSRPILVSSGFRSRTVNAAVGGKPTSQHTQGLAVDLRVPGMTPNQVVQALQVSGLRYDQLIEEFGSWTHVSIPAVGQPPRGQVLVIDQRGTRPFEAVAVA